MRANTSGNYRLNRIEWMYVFILLVAAGLRFALLGDSQLDDQQANLALQALSVSKGDSVIISGDPGYIALTSTLFNLIGTSGFLARFWPALFGTCAVLLPLLYQKWLGRSTAIVLAGLIALNPVLIGASRTAGGSMLALVGLLAAIGFWLNNRRVLSGVFLGIAITGGRDFWPGLLILAVIFIAFGSKLANGVNNRLTKGHDRPQEGILLGIAALTALLLSTVFLSVPNGISAIGSSLVQYFTTWGEPDGSQLAGNSLAWLIIEMPLLILGIWGLIDGLREKEQRRTLLGVWFGLGLVLAVLNTGVGSGHFMWVSIPVMILAAIKLSELLRLPVMENRLIFFVEITLVLALVTFSLLNALSLINNSYQTPEETRNRIIGAFLPIILLAAMTALFAWGWSFKSTRNGFVAGVVVLLMLGLISNAWKSAGFGSRPQFETVFSNEFPLGSHTLLNSVKDISLSHTAYAYRIDIQVIGLEQPSVLWALRDYNELTSGSVLDPNRAPSIILTDRETIIELPTSYRGQKILWAVKPDYSAMKAIDWIRWSIYRVAPVRNTELILWAKNDLFPGAQTP